MKSILTLSLLVFLLTGCDRKPDATSSAPPSPQPAAPSTPTTEPPAPLPPVSAEEPSVTQGLALLKEGKLLEARALLQPLTQLTNTSDQVFAAVSEINTRLLFSPALMPGKTNYTIQVGDTLGKLAKTFGTTTDLIKKSNGKTTDVIRIGDMLRIFQGKFVVDISKSANTLTLTDEGVFFKRYRVGTGQYDKTPEGTFKITTRVANPPWYRGDGATVPYGDPANILGTHWLGLDIPRYGIHGTWETNSIGKHSSAGCVRLLNDDVAELYSLLPLGTPVNIHP